MKFNDATQMIFAEKRLSKQFAEMMANEMFEAVDNGTENPADVYIRAKYLSTVLDDFLKKLKPVATTYFANHGTGSSFTDVGITVKAVAGRWDYKHDSEHSQVKAKLAAREEVLKAAYKAMIDGKKFADVDTGEIIEPAKYTPGEDSITVTFPN